MDNSKDSFDNSYEEKEELFGHPYKELQNYFSNYPIKGKLLDLGCGQGRDAIFLASLGYEVIAIDSSRVGIKQMLEKANRKGLTINGVIGDVLEINLEEKFDIILFDMILHSFKESQQLELLKKYSSMLGEKGIFCIIYPDDMNVEYFMRLLSSLNNKWKLVEKIIINDVPKIDNENNDFKFEMLVAQINK